MLETLLKNLGLNETETAVYLAVIKHGRIAPTQVANLTNINRTTVYATAKLLKKKGLISEDLGGSRTELVALPPEDLGQLLEKEERKLKEKQSQAQTAITELKKLAVAASYAVPKITFIEHDQIEWYLYRRSPIWSKNIAEADPDKSWWGVQDHTFVEHLAYQKWIDWYWKNAAPDDISLHLLSNQSDIETEMKKRNYAQRHIRFWPDSEVTSTIWINGDYVTMIQSRTEPHYLVEFHDRVMAHNLRQVYKTLWHQTAGARP